MSDVFISYSRLDKDFVGDLREALMSAALASIARDGTEKLSLRALALEAAMLTLYPTWLDIRSYQEFLQTEETLEHLGATGVEYPSRPRRGGARV